MDGPQALLMRRGELISNQRKNTTLSLKKCIKLNYLQIVCPVVYLEQILDSSIKNQAEIELD